MATRIEALEKDAIVAQAGYTADVYEYPHPLKARDLFDVDDQDTDTTNTRSAIFKMVCLETGRTFPDDGGNIKLDENMTSAMNDVYHRIIDKAHALVDQHWHTIVRVAKHLERHGDIDNQAVLDSLIERAAAT